MARARKKTSAPKLPRVPLPRKAAQRHADETKKQWRDRKHKKRTPEE